MSEAKSERLVVEKSLRQLRVEGLIRIIFPPLIAVGCYRFLGPGLWQVPLILFSLATIAVVSNQIALFAGGRLVTPAERWRRQMERLSTRPASSVFFWTFLFCLDLMLSLTVPMASIEEFWNLRWLMLPLLVSCALFASAFSVLFMRRQARFLRAEHEPLQLQSPWEWIRKTAPLRVITIAAAVVGYFVARNFSSPLCLLIFAAVFWIGFALEGAIRIRMASSKPLLWTNFSFPAMLATGMLHHGIPFALLVGFMDALMNGVGVVSAILGAGGFLAGILIAFGFWAVAKLNTVRNRGAEQ